MDEIRVRYTVDQKEAVLAGQKFYGDVETTVDPAMLTQEQREELAECDTDKGIFVLNRYFPGPGEPTFGTRDDAHVVILLDARIKARQEKVAQAKKEVEDLLRRCAEDMHSEKRRETLEKIVRGSSFHSAIPSYVPYDHNDAVEAWWQEHSGEFAEEMATIRTEIEREKKAEEERIDQLRKERADKILAAGIDGLLKRDDDNEWESLHLSESDYGQYWSMVSTLRDQAQAEAERRNEAEKIARQEQIDAWVAKKGTENQKGRHALGLLPEDEVLDAMRDEAFQALESFPRYEKIKRDDLDHNEYCEAGIKCKVESADSLTAEQYDKLAAIQTAAPRGATMKALDHRCECKNNDCDAAYTRSAAQVELTVGAFIFTREYAL